VEYRADATICNACPLKAQCTPSDHGRQVHRSFYASYLERVRSYHQTPAYQKAMRKRKVWVEPLFAEDKDWHGLRRFRLRRLWRVNCEALRIAAGQNLKRLLKKRGWGRRPFPVEALCASFLAAYGWIIPLYLGEGSLYSRICSTSSLRKRECIPSCCSVLPRTFSTGWTTPVELDCTNRGNLSIGKISILNFEIDDQLAHGNRKRAVVIFSLRFGRSKEANDTMCIKGISSTTETSFCRTCFLCSFYRWNSKKYDGANPFIQALLWGSTPLLEQMIVVRSLPSFSLGLWHRCHSTRSAKETRRGASFASSMILLVCYQKSPITTRICGET
jgi:hypothetical protein